jgi:hypothetical protein
MASYADFVGQVIGEPVAATGTDILEAHVSNYMIEGAQVVVNAMPKEMLWAMEAEQDFVSSGSPEGVAVGSNKILQVVRLSDDDLLTTTYGVDGLADTTPAPTVSAWEINKEHTDVVQTSTSGNGTLVEFAINTNNSGVPRFFITSKGQNYAIDDTIVVTDPGNTLGLAEVTVNAVVKSSSARAEVECREIPAALIGRATPGSGWQEESSQTDPVYYKLGGSVNILPTSTSTKSKVYWVKVPPTSWITDAYNETFMAGTILTEIEPLIMLYVLKKVYGQKLALAQFGTVTQGSSLETYIADEDLEMAQGQQLLITDLQSMLMGLEKEFQLGIQLLMQGTYKPELIENAQTQDTYSKLQGKGA